MNSIDQKEINKFKKNAQEWWDHNGEFKLLHQINPTRLDYIIAKITQHFNLERNKGHTLLEGFKILDVGCGGGLMSIPLAKCNAKVTGIDANSSNVEVAQGQAQKEGVDAKFYESSAEELATKGLEFDVVLALEIIEHVANPHEFFHSLTKLVKPGGLIVLSTINRTTKSYIQAKLLAEYILGWVPKGTHEYNKFIKPSELNDMLTGSKFSLKELRGLTYSISSNSWHLSMDVSVNYFAYIG